MASDNSGTPAAVLAQLPAVKADKQLAAGGSVSAPHDAPQPDGPVAAGENPPCPLCNEPLYGKKEAITVDPGDGGAKRELHADCFVCTTCAAMFAGEYWEHNDKPYCLTHYCEAAGYLCAACGELITDGTVMLALDRVFHMERCFRCPVCSRAFTGDADERFFSPDADFPYCEGCVPAACAGAKCSKRVGPLADTVEFHGKRFHRACLACTKCATTLAPADAVPHGNGAPHCAPCRERLLALRASRNDTDGAMTTPPAAAAAGAAGGADAAKQCGMCGNALGLETVTYKGAKYDRACFRCATCAAQLQSKVFPIGDKLYCEQCGAAAAGDTCAKCAKAIVGEAVVSALERKWHAACLVCHECGEKLGSGAADLYKHATSGEPACEKHAS